MEFLKVILLGLVEGITEWLPISSTGHLIILNSFLALKASDAFISFFNVVIQLGAILAVVVLFFKNLWPFKSGKNNVESWLSPYIQKDKAVLWLKVIIACIPGILMLPFLDTFENLFYNPVSVSLALIVFGILFIIVERINKKRDFKIKKIEDLGYSIAFFIGCFQILAMIFPGTSRSGATILGALLMGVGRGAAAQFTFYLAIPVMAGASLIKLMGFGFSFTHTELLMLLLAMLVAFITSLAVIRFLINYVKKHDFEFFGWYRIILGMLVIFYFTLV